MDKYFKPEVREPTETLMDKFAMAALSNYKITQALPSAWEFYKNEDFFDCLAKGVYKYADAMMKAREVKDE